MLFHLFLTTTLDVVIEETESMSSYEWLAQGHMASECLSQDSTPVVLFPHPELFLIWNSASISCQNIHFQAGLFF